MSVTSDVLLIVLPTSFSTTETNEIDVANSLAIPSPVASTNARLISKLKVGEGLYNQNEGRDEQEHSAQQADQDTKHKPPRRLLILDPTCRDCHYRKGNRANPIYCDCGDENGIFEVFPYRLGRVKERGGIEAIEKTVITRPLCIHHCLSYFGVVWAVKSGKDEHRLLFPCIAQHLESLLLGLLGVALGVMRRVGMPSKTNYLAIRNG
jgi:hypothetical protein